MIGGGIALFGGLGGVRGGLLLISCSSSLYSLSHTGALEGGGGGALESNGGALEGGGGACTDLGGNDFLERGRGEFFFAGMGGALG